MNTKNIAIAVGAVVLALLGWWWFSMQSAQAPTTETGQVQGAEETNTYQDNSKDGAVDTSVKVETGAQY